MSHPVVSTYDKYKVPSERPRQDFLYIGDVLFRLKISSPTLYRMIKSGQFPQPKKWAGKNVWLDSDVTAYIETLFAV